MADIKNIAGRAKDILVGKNVKDAIESKGRIESSLKNILRKNKPRIENANKQLQIATNTSDNIGIERAKKSLDLLNQVNREALNVYGDAKKNVVKERMKTYGARTGAGALAVTPGAIGYGVYKHNKKKKEKTAYDIVIDAFEKMAEEEY